jgi:serine/threonine protein kinase
MADKKNLRDKAAWKMECPRCGKKEPERVARGSMTSWIFDFGLCRCPQAPTAPDVNSNRPRAIERVFADRLPEPSDLNPVHFADNPDLNASSPPGQLREIAAGTVLAGQYKVLNKLGIGGMGDVYRCEELALNRFVAVKILRADLVANAVLLSRFQREAKAVAMLEHPNIIKMHNFLFDESGRPLMVMELLNGVSLSEFLAEGPLPLLRTRRIVAQICDALMHAHNHKVIHRDLKPNNIVVLNPGRENETIKLLDFGIAKIAGDPSLKATETGDVIGSPEYMSPEQCLGKAIDARTDQYSLGCLIFEMMTGQTPFVRESKVAIVMAHVHDAAPSMAEVCDKQIPADIEGCVARLLKKRPQDRFRSEEAVKNIFLGESKSAHAEPWYNSHASRIGFVLFTGICFLIYIAGAGNRFFKSEKEILAPGEKLIRNMPDRPDLERKAAKPLRDAFIQGKLDRNPNDYNALLDRGIRIRSSDLKKAIEDWHRSLLLNPYRQGMTATEVKEKNLAQPEVVWGRCHEHLGYACMVQGKYEEGIAELNKAIAVQPENPRNYLNRSLAYKQLGKIDLAKRDLKKYEQLLKTVHPFDAMDSITEWTTGKFQSADGNSESGSVSGKQADK